MGSIGWRRRGSRRCWAAGWPRGRSASSRRGSWWSRSPAAPCSGCAARRWRSGATSRYERAEAERARCNHDARAPLDPGRWRGLRGAPAAGLRLKQSALVRPVAGPIVGAWGAHRDAALGVTLARRGIELRARAAELIRAPAAGRVRFVGEVPGLGHGIAIDHGDGYV